MSGFLRTNQDSEQCHQKAIRNLSGKVNMLDEGTSTRKMLGNKQDLCRRHGKPITVVKVEVTNHAQFFRGGNMQNILVVSI